MTQDNKDDFDHDRRRASDLQIGELIGTVKALAKNQETLVLNQERNRQEFLGALDVVIHKSNTTAAMLTEHILDDTSTKSIVIALATWRKDPATGKGADEDIQSLKDSRIRFGGIMIGLGMLGGLAGEKISGAFDHVKSLFGA